MDSRDHLHYLRDYPGLTIERSPSGNLRFRVRVEGNPRRRISLTVGPEHYDFLRQFRSAREGHPPQRDRGAKIRSTGHVSDEIKTMLKKAATRAAERGHDFDLSGEFLLGLLERQGFKCAISKLDFDLSPKESYHRRPFTMSIDRIDGRLGYTKSNVRLVCTMVNIARSDWSDDDFLQMCRAVYLAQVSHE